MKRAFLGPQTSANKVETFLQNVQAMERMYQLNAKSKEFEPNASEFIVSLFENGRCSIQHLKSGATLFLNN